MVKPAARGRPRKFDKDDKLQIILKEFWRKGFSATSLDDLSAVTGLSRPSLYAAYGDKAAMYISALEAFGRIMEARAVPPLLNKSDLVSALSGFYQGALDVYFGGEKQALGCLVFTTAIADAANEPAIKAALQDFLGRMDGGLQACLQRLKPDLPEERRLLLAQIAGGALTNLATRARAGAARAELDAIAAASAAMIAEAARR